MSIVKFELKEEHIKLVRQLHIDNDSKYPQFDIDHLFNGDNLYDDINLILNGKTSEIKPDDGFSDSRIGYTDEQISEWDTLLSELTTALTIILYTGSFTPGNYMKKYGDVNWIKK